MKFDHIYNRDSFEKLLSWILFWEKYKKNYKSLNINRKTILFDQQNCFLLWKINLDKDIYVLEIKQKSKNDPRITLTKDAFKIMEDIWTNFALIIFYSDDSKSYRLSLLTRKKTWWEKEESDPKRYSFLLWEWEKIKTVEESLFELKFLKEKKKKTKIETFEDLLICFNVEIVREEFFNKYLNLYIRLYKSIVEANDFYELLLKNNVDIVSFTKNLLGKIVFLYFIQKKWWFKNKETWIWDNLFFNNIWDDFNNKWEKNSMEKKNYFYNDYLEYIFYEWLNIENRDSDFSKKFWWEIPYLNWWLFKEDYPNWKNNIAKISNDVFSNEKENWILDIFNLYNFTIDEDDLYDKEVAIDPEMLWKIFEKMISIDSKNIWKIVETYSEKSYKKRGEFITMDIENWNVWNNNKKLWAFYTPREIVHYMTKESLINYLINNLDWKKEDKEKKVRDLFNFKDKYLTDNDLSVEKIKNDFENIKSIIIDVDEKIKKVKILDPAIGSGAFPMWILHEISTLRYYIYDVLIKHILWEKSNISMYRIKKEIIENNIYWVDIEPGAIDIARLRFWLSLIVDEVTPEPLPNFEFKFVCANTLLPIEKEQIQTDIEWYVKDEAKLETLKKYKWEYFNISDKEKKEVLKNRIRNYTRINNQQEFWYIPSKRAVQIDEFWTNFDNQKHSHSFFDPSLMMSEWRWFDIIISNPPYIKERDNVDVFEAINNSQFWKKYHQGKMDFWYYFLHFSMDVVKNNWCIIFITNSYWTKSTGSSKLINRIDNELTFDKIIDFWDLMIFNNVSWKHMIHSYIKKTTTSLDKTLLIENSWININNNLWILLNSNTLIKWNKIYYSSDDIFWKVDYSIIDDFFIVSQWVVEAPDKISSKISKENPKFKKWEWVFVLSENEIKLKGFSWTEQNAIKKYLNTNNIFKYWIKFDNEYLIYTNSDTKNNIENWTYENIKNHLDYYSSIISSSNWPYWIHRTRKECFFENEKIICKWMFKSPEFCYDDKKYYVWMSFSVIIKKENWIYDLKFLLWILNSKLWEFWFNQNWKKRWVWVDIWVDVFRNFPIPKNILEEKQQSLISIADEILKIANTAWYNLKKISENQKDLEDKIDKMVYDLYGLSDEEVRLVEKSLKK